MDASVSFGIVRLFVSLEVLISVEGLVAFFMIASVRLCTWGSVDLANVRSEEMMLGKGFMTAFLYTCEWFGAVVPVLMRLEVLRRPKSLLAVFKITGERSRRFRKVASGVCLEMGFSKI